MEKKAARARLQQQQPCLHSSKRVGVNFNRIQKKKINIARYDFHCKKVMKRIKSSVRKKDIGLTFLDGKSQNECLNLLFRNGRMSEAAVEKNMSSISLL